jgi:general secretion pathway protein L
MSETLVIRLRAAEGAQASWLIVDANGARSGPVQTGPLDDAMGLAKERPVVLLVPGSEVTFAAPELPLRSASRLMQAVPYALEEQLASDVEGLHFSIGARAAGASATPVAVVSRAQMDRWLEACEAAGIHPDVAYADTAVVPSTAGGCTLLLDGEALHVRHEGSVPFTLETDPLSDALALALDGRADAAAGHVTFFAAPAEYERYRDAIEGLRSRTATLQVKLLPDGPLPLLAAQSLQGAAVNLLQGPYAARTSLATGLRRWRLPAALAAATALVFVAVQALTAWQLSRSEKALDAQIASVFAQAMPGQKVVDPRAQMQGILGGGGGQSAFLPALSALSRALAGTPQARVQSISCRGDVVDLRLMAPSVGSLDAVKQAVSVGGLSAELQSATPRGTQVEGRLVVRLARS